MIERTTQIPEFDAAVLWHEELKERGLTAPSHRAASVSTHKTHPQTAHLTKLTERQKPLTSSQCESWLATPGQFNSMILNCLILIKRKTKNGRGSVDSRQDVPSHSPCLILCHRDPDRWDSSKHPRDSSLILTSHLSALCNNRVNRLNYFVY